jgi:hypothetical protein
MSLKPIRGLRISRCGFKIERMRNPVRAFSTPRAEDSSHTRVAQGIVKVGQPVFIAAGQKVAISVEQGGRRFRL